MEQRMTINDSVNPSGFKNEALCARVASNRMDIEIVLAKGTGAEEVLATIPKEKRAQLANFLITAQ